MIRRNVMIVGDSISGEFFFTFVSAMLSQAFTNEQGELDKPRSWKNRKSCDNICDWNKPCTGPVLIDCGNEIPSFTISYERSNELDDVHSWIGRIKKENISIVIANTGLHATEGVASRVKDTVQSLYEMHPNLEIVWRKTSGGHNYCIAMFNNPPSTMMTNENFSRLNISISLSNLQMERHNWDLYEKMDLQVEQMLTREFPQILILDTSYSTHYRTDSHSYDRSGEVDCAHYCMPGPIDSWLTFLYNALLRASGIVPSRDSIIADQRAIDILTQSSTYTEGIILQSKKYPDLFYQIENGRRRIIANPSYLALLQGLHVTSKTYNPRNDSQVMIETIDEDFNFYGIIPTGRPIL